MLCGHAYSKSFLDKLIILIIARPIAALQLYSVFFFGIARSPLHRRRSTVTRHASQPRKDRHEEQVDGERHGDQQGHLAPKRLHE